MTIALRPAPTAPRRIARAAIYTSFAEAEPHWRALERSDVLATAYQRYDVLARWQRHIGSRDGVEPLIVVAFDAAGTPLVLWPLGSRRVAGLAAAEFLGGKHVNFNMAVWRRDVATGMAREAIASLLTEATGKVDALLLRSQPVTWDGIANPVTLLSHAPSASFAYSGALQRDFDALLRERTNSEARKKMRKKERALASRGTVRFTRAATADQARQILAAFLEQKRARMLALGQPDAFSDDAVHDFLDSLAIDSDSDGHPLAELYALSVDGAIIATLGGMAWGERFSSMFTSIGDRFGPESPGEQLLVHVVRSLCERGLRTFDLGTGEARYKGMFCPDVEPLCDSFIALTPAGRALAAAMRFGATAKRIVKANPALLSMIAAARRTGRRLIHG
jgi:CelD/BcsL family acetyltransferase involved in cellulose biosynthesis